MNFVITNFVITNFVVSNLLCSFKLCSFKLCSVKHFSVSFCSFELCSFKLCSFKLFSFSFCSFELWSYKLCSFKPWSFDLFQRKAFALQKADICIRRNCSTQNGEEKDEIHHNPSHLKLFIFLSRPRFKWKITYLHLMGNSLKCQRMEYT